MFDTQNENDKHWWGKEMSETRSPLSNFYGIKEPINSISALLGIIYILLYYFQYNITLKLYVIINLLFAFVAHATYNYLAIKLDGISLALPIFHIFLYYNWYNEFIILLGLISIFRQFIPPLGVVDLSPLVAIFALRFIQEGVIVVVNWMYRMF